MFKDFYRRHQKQFDHFDGFLINNSVLERGLVVAPVIVAANTLLNALILGISFFLITFFAVLLGSFVPKRLPYSIRVILYVVFACLLYIPVSMLMTAVFRESVLHVGFFLPLLVTNSLIVTKTETRFLKKKRLPMMLDVFTHSLGFAAVIILAGFLREIIGNGSVLGQSLDIPVKLEVMKLPFGGFILLGFLSALVQRFRHYLTRPETSHRHRISRRKGGSV